MSIYFLWPNHTIDPANVLSASTEAGLVVEVPAVDDDNKGALRLRSSGNPYSAHDLELDLIGGGNPTGYSTNDNFRGAGASLIWKESTDAADEWRGYIDSIYLVRVEMPFTGSIAARSHPSHPRELPDGTLGLAYIAGTTAWRFAKYSADGTFSSVATVTGTTTLSGLKPDFVILPSGRLVAFVRDNIPAGGLLYSYYSDDDGATWTKLGETFGIGALLHDMNCEYVPEADMIVMVNSNLTAIAATEVWVSRDGGVSFTKVSTEGNHQGMATCVTPDGVVLAATPNLASNVIAVSPIAPGGGFGDAVLTTCAANMASRKAAPGICTRDDGTIWVFGMNSDATSISMDANVSRDGGLTWEEPANAILLWDTDFAAAFDGYTALAFGMWNGSMMCVAHSDATTGTSFQHHLLTFGGWDDITDVKRDLVTLLDGEPYEHVYLPIDYPDSMGWTRANVVAGATVTNPNPGHLNIVATAVSNSGYTSNGTFWTGAATDSRRLRFRVRVNSGGSVADNRSRLRFGITDGVNDQEVIIRFSTTQVRILDGPGNIIATQGVDHTDWVEYLIAFAHDNPGPDGEVSVYRRQIDETFWTVVVEAGVVAEQAGTNNDIRFGGSVGGAVDWDISYLGVADDDNLLIFNAGSLNPDALAPRSLSAAVDYRLVDGINVGGFNGAGVPEDSFTLATTYSYGKENVWAELRPSRHVRSDGDNAQWDLDFDAGAGHVFHADTIALVGTNFRTATWYLDDDPAFGSPAVTQALDAVFASAAGGTGSAGMFVPAVAPTWRKDVFKSTGGRRWFFSDSAGARFEIIGNDADRLYVEGTPANGAWSIFGDRMGATHTEAHVRYARLRVAGQQTADDYYRVGCLLTNIRLALDPVYAHNFTDRVQPNVTVHESTPGYRSGATVGPRRRTLSIQWTPINRMKTAFAHQLEDFYNAVDASVTPFVFWRDSTDQSTIQLVRVIGTFSKPNERGERANALASIDQLVLEDEL